MPTKEIAPGVLAVTELPEDAKNFTVIESHGYFPSPRIEHSIGGVDLPPGQWSIVGWSDEMTEDEAQLICHSIFGRYYKDFMSKETEGYAPAWTLETATESFASLLRSHGITDRALIIKKEK